MRGTLAAGLNLAPWQPALRKAWRRFASWGLPGAAGTALLGAAALLAAWGVPQATQALHGEERTMQAARSRAAQALQQRELGRTQVDPATRWRESFPAATERHRRITNLMALAAALNLQARRSEVRSVPEEALGLTRVRVVLPLAGPYAGLRRFVDQALRDDPALSLDLVRLERSDPQAAELRAELHWSLWMRAADAAASPGGVAR
jgi:hypothetical protein